MNLNFISLLIMAACYIFAGVSHFRSPGFFLKITPAWVPSPEKVNIVVGAIEIILGIALLIPFLTKFAAWGVIGLLVFVFPANIYHFQKSLQKKKHIWMTLVRLPLQLALIYWAYSFIA